MYPRIKSINPIPEKKLLVVFQNDVQKVYDCTHLLEDEVFYPLHNIALFNMVRVDAGGYGVSWNDELDLSEAELWIHGRLLETNE